MSTVVKKFLTSALSLGLVAWVSLSASALELKISHQWKANVDGRDRAARLFVKEVEKADPSIKFRIYPAQ